MKTADKLDQIASAIRTAIIALVERTDGPVTLAQIDREIPGFANDGPGGREYFVQHSGVECVIWTGMTDAGLMALRDVMRGRKVAVQFVNPMLYVLENCVCENENWQPIVLLPKTAANLDTPNWLVRASQGGRDHCIARANREGRSDYQPLTPRPLRFTADQIAVA
jgi:hypothetical protein